MNFTSAVNVAIIVVVCFFSFLKHCLDNKRKKSVGEFSNYLLERPAGVFDVALKKYTKQKRKKLKRRPSIQ